MASNDAPTLTPRLLRTATAEYFAAEDLLGRRLQERTRLRPQYSTPSSVLWKDWGKWTEENGEEVNKDFNKSFSQALQNRGFQCVRIHHVRMFKGVALRQDAPVGGDQ